MIPNVRHADNDLWVEAYHNPPVSYSDIKQLLYETIAFIRKQLLIAKNPIIAFSSGKDGIVLEFIINKIMRLNIKKFTVVSQGLEYDFMDEFTKDCDIIHTNFNIDNCFNNGDFLKGNILESTGTWAYYNSKQDLYIKNNQADMCFFGRRIADGNTVKSKSYIRKRDGVRIVNPLKDWTNDELISFIRYYNVKLPIGYFSSELKMFTHGADDLLEHFYQRADWFRNPSVWLSVLKKYNLQMYHKVKQYVENRKI